METINSDVSEQMSADRLWYLYGFCTRETEEQVDIDGLDTRYPVQAFHHAGLTACVSRVEQQEFTGNAAAIRLQDIEWVTSKAQLHQQIVGALMHQGSLFPVPFGTIFSSLAKLADAMQGRQMQISDALQRLRGCREWAVQIGLDKPAAVAARTAGLARLRPAADSPGLRHLQRQRLKRQAAHDMDDWLNQWQMGLLRELEPLSAGFRDRQRLLLEGLICNWAFLVADERQAAFFERVHHWRTQGAECGLQVSIKGPWPPYSFCS